MCCLPLWAQAQTIAFINPGKKDEPFWRTVSESMHAASRSLGMRLEEQFAERQHLSVFTIAKAIAARPAAERPDYVILTNDYGTGPELLRIFDGTGIRSFMAFSTLTTPERVQHGGPREQFKDWIGSLEPRAQDAGYLTAQALIAKGRAMRAHGPDGKLHLLAIAGDRSTNSSIQRNEGMQRAVRQAPDVVLEQEYGMTEQDAHQLLHPGMAPPPEPETPEQRTERYNRNTAVFVDTSIGTDLDGKDIARALVVLAVFAGAEYVGNQLVQDKYYTMLTDIQIAERIAPDSPEKVQEYSEHQLLQGDSGAMQLLWQRDTDMRKYQLKVVSFANKANLDWQDAEQPLHQGLLRSLAGIF